MAIKALVVSISRRRAGTGLMVYLNCGHELAQGTTAHGIVTNAETAQVFAEDFVVDCADCGNDEVGEKLFQAGFAQGEEIARSHDQSLDSAKIARGTIADLIKTIKPKTKTTKTQRRRWTSGVYAGFWKALSHKAWHKSQASV